jgi:Cu(I)/Ag(I) efflux system membrane protein CusA/SilA
MIARVVSWSAHHPVTVIVAALVLAATGELGRRALHRDAIPDLSSPQIVLVAEWMGHPAAEVADGVTRVLTSALADVPGATAVRGQSMSDMAYVDVVFGTLAELAPGRRAIVERVAAARGRLPANIRLQIGPLASSTGWVFQYAIVDATMRETAGALRRLQDEKLRPALAALPGVAEVASVGGVRQELVVEVEPDRLRARAAAFSDVAAAVDAAIRANPRAGVDELKALPLSPALAPTQPAPPRLGDVARVRLADEMPTGLADLQGMEMTIGGIVIAQRDADLPRLIAAVKQTLARECAHLYRGIQIIPVYDRSELIARTGHTLLRALVEEIAVVVLVIVLFLLHGPSALVPLLTLPLVLLLTFAAMWLCGVPATIMSLGGIGIALGMAVDADVVALEACHRRIERDGGPGGDRRAQLIAAAGTFAPAILTALVIAALTFLPVFAFTGETGRLLRPLALTKTLVIAAAALVTLTLAPALRERFLRRRVSPEFANPLTRTLVRLYRPFVQFALARPVLTLVTAGLAVLSCLPIVFRLGGEFLPRIDEGDLLFMPTTLPGVSPDQVEDQVIRQDRALRNMEEVATVFGKVGRADTATDPAPYSMVETIVRLRPRAEWPKTVHPRWYSQWAPAWLRPWLAVFWPDVTATAPGALADKLDRVAKLPGWVGAWTAPARARMDMMATGVRTPLGLRIVAADAARLDALGTALRAITAGVPGTRGAIFESLGDETWPALDFDPAELSRHHVDPALARAMADLVIHRGQVGEVERKGQRLRVRIVPDVNFASLLMGVAPEPLRGVLDQLREVTVRADGGGAPVPLALVGRATHVRQPAVIRSERGELVAYVYIDLADGIDLERYVARAQSRFDAAVAAGELHLAPGERLEWTGQYQLLLAGQRRLRWIVPLVALSMLVLLFLQFRSLTKALIVLLSVPFALVGSFWTLFWLDYPLSAPVWIGLLSVLGLAMQTGVVMVVYIDEAFHRRVRAGLIRNRDDIVEAHAEGTVQRLRPKIMTITTMAAGLLPLLWSDGSGAEIMRRVAAPMIGGLLTSAFLTLEVLPVVYTIWRNRQLRRAQRQGTSIEAIVERG